MELEPKIGKLQRECKDLGIPVMIAFEGYDAAGKGVQIGELIKALDPRGFEVHAVKKETEEEQMHPFLWRFWTKMPPKGRIAIYDSKYRKVLIDRFDKRPRRKKWRMLTGLSALRRTVPTDDGMVIIKIFLAIDKSRKNVLKILSSKETSWRVSEGDLKRNKEFDEYEAINEEMLMRTDTEHAPWNIVEAVDRRFATAKIYAIVAQTLAGKVEEVRRKERLGQFKEEESTEPEKETVQDKKLTESILAKADLSLSYSKEEYRKRLEQAQKKMENFTENCTAGGFRWCWDLKAGMLPEKEERSSG